MKKTLADVKIGTEVNVVGVHGDGAIRKRILDMGVIKNTNLTVIKRAPLGDPIEVEIRGYKLTIRSNEAALIEVNL